MRFDPRRTHRDRPVGKGRVREPFPRVVGDRGLQNVEALHARRPKGLGDICKAAGFRSNKALLQHQRAKLGHVHEMRSFLNSEGVCQACGGHFHTSIRVMRHLSDARRPKCRDVLLGSVSAEFDPNEDLKLRIIERELRAKARSEGHSHPLAVGQASIGDKYVGRVQL